MSRHRITIATGIRFWLESSGAEARIAQIVSHLQRCGNDVEIFFTADGQGVPAWWNDHVPIVSMDRFTGRIGPLRRQFIRARAMLARLGRGDGASAAKHDWRSTISDVEQAAFADYLRQRGADTLLVEYIWLTRLVTGLPRGLRQSLRCLVDTHDVMHLRTQQFAEHSRQVYMAVDRAGERAALLNYDGVLAIQHSDAAVLRDLCPERPVSVVAHAGDVTALPAPRSGEAVRFLFVGSKSHPNVDSLKGLLAEAWRPLYQRYGERIQLDIVGSIGDRREELPEAAGIVYQGIVEDLVEVYARADVVLAPVLYGTGLKIKVVEALCFGKATVTMPAGVDGMPIDGEPPCAVLDDWSDYLKTCVHLVEDASYGRALEGKALAYAREHFSEAAAFGELDRAIDAHSL